MCDTNFFGYLGRAYSLIQKLVPHELNLIPSIRPTMHMKQVSPPCQTHTRKNLAASDTSACWQPVHACMQLTCAPLNCATEQLAAALMPARLDQSCCTGTLLTEPKRHGRAEQNIHGYILYPIDRAQDFRRVSAEQCCSINIKYVHGNRRRPLSAGLSPSCSSAAAQ